MNLDELKSWWNRRPIKVDALWYDQIGENRPDDEREYRYPEQKEFEEAFREWIDEGEELFGDDS